MHGRNGHSCYKPLKKVVTERFFEPYRSTWPSLALMLQTVKKKLSRRDSSSRIEVHGRYGHSCYQPLKKLSRKNSSSRLEVHGRNRHSCNKTVKTSCHGKILRAVSKCMAGTGTHATKPLKQVKLSWVMTSHSVTDAVTWHIA